jgi:protein ImuA
MAAADQPVNRAAVFSALRARIARVERGAAAEAGIISLCDTIDRALPGGGLGRGALHEVRAADPGAAAAFCALILARATGAVVWISATPDAWPPGLSAFGLDPADLVLVRAGRPADGLWAFEEALRSPAIAGALLMVRGAAPDMVAGRRLQLAAEVGGGIGLMLLADTELMPPSPARSRWRVSAAAVAEREHPCWNLTLLRCSGGRPGAWTVMWHRDTAQLGVCANLPVAPLA